MTHYLLLSILVMGVLKEDFVKCSIMSDTSIDESNLIDSSEDVVKVSQSPSALPGLLIPTTYASVSIIGVSGRSVDLPCNITAPDGDSVYLVLWFREDLATPIYSYDLRETSGPRHWHDVELLQSRAMFHADVDMPYLTLSDLDVDDVGVYKCRVDFERAPTTNSRLNLTIIVLPSSLVLQDEEGLPIQSVTKAVKENSDLKVSCVAVGGSPPPVLEWLLDEKPVTTAHLTRLPGTTLSHLLVTNITRNYVMSKLTCLANVDTMDPPMTVTATVDMNLKPQQVLINKPTEPISEGKTYDFMCTSRGSRPPAVITWWMNKRKLDQAADQSWQEGNVSWSVLRLSVNATMHLSTVTCSSHNPNIVEDVLSDHLLLSVYYNPRAYIVMGASLNPLQISEGDDVYFECEVDANPPAYKVTWKHKGVDVRQNKKSGVIITQKSLVLQKVTREDAGQYQCTASNVEGDSSSTPLNLSIHFSPVCKEGTTSSYRVSSGETVQVRCQVDAVPHVSKFFWVFNNTAESLSVPEGAFSKLKNQERGGISVLDYTPTNDFEFGTLQCLSENSVAKQENPCIFQILPVALPIPPTNCKALNFTTSSVHVKCHVSSPIDSTQKFYMEVRSVEDSTLLANMSSKKAKFVVSGLEAGAQIKVSIYSGNSRGRSTNTESLQVDVPTLPVKQLETRHDTESNSRPVESERRNKNSSGSSESVELNYISVFGALAGAILALVTISIVSTLSIRKCIDRRRNYHKPYEGDQESKTTRLSDKKSVSEVTNETKIPEMNIDKTTAISENLKTILDKKTAIRDISGRRNLKNLSDSISTPSSLCINGLDLPLPSTQPQFSNHSFIFDEKGFDTSYLSTPPEPAPPFPYEKHLINRARENVYKKFPSSLSISSDSINDSKYLLQLSLDSGSSKTILAPPFRENNDGGRKPQLTPSMYSTLSSYDKRTLDEMVRNTKANLMSLNRDTEIPIVSSILTVKSIVPTMPHVDDRRESSV